MDIDNMPISSDGLSIQFTSSLEFDSLSYQRSHEFIAMASIKAPSFENSSRASRAPVDLVAIIDRSDSMTGTKIQLVKETISFAIKQLKDADTFGIVLYSTSVETLLKPTKMTPEGKKHALSCIETIKTFGTTNLSGGLFQALMDIKSASGSNDVVSVLLFTDGLANVGVKDTKQIIKGMDGMLKIIDKPCSVFTFGFGEDHDSNMLKEIAEASNGIYYYIETAEAIPTAFADCIGGLLSVFAQNIVLKIQTPMKSKVQIKKVMTKYKLIEEIPGEAYEVRMNDLYSEEQRDILCLIYIPELPGPSNEMLVMEYELQYKNLTKNGATDRASVSSKVSRPVESTRQQVDDTPIDIQRNRISCAEAIEAAKSYADKGNLEYARKILNDEIARIKSSKSGLNSLCQVMIRELEVCLVNLKDKTTYVAMGEKKMVNFAMGHHQQRSAWAESNYITTPKSAMMERSPMYKKP